MTEPHSTVIMPLESNVGGLSSHIKGVLVCLSIGALGGALQGIIFTRPVTQSLLCGLLFGTVFGLLFPKRATSPGAGLIWGLAFAVLLWIVFPAGILSRLALGSHSMFADAREQFPELVAFLLCLGMPVGLALGSWGALHSTVVPVKFDWKRAILAGGFAGVLGGLIFGRWVSSGDYFPLLAGYGPLNISRMAIIALHFGVALLIGITFGLLFQRDVKGYGSCMGWGLGYAILWWVLGQLALLPLVAHRQLDWSADQASAVFGSLVGHILYGLILGVAYASLDRLWLRLFVQSDPLNREVGGAGVNLLRSLSWGAAAGLVGGIVASPVLLATHALPKIVGLDTTVSGFRGLILHLVVSAAIGMTYGLLFRNEASSLGLGIAWGWLFGLIWWFVGPMTLLPLLLTGVCDWSTDAASALLPSLMGHLIYGAATAFVFLSRNGCFWIRASPPAKREKCARWALRRQHFGCLRWR